MRSVILAAGIMLAATTAQAQTVSCQSLQSNGQPSPEPALVLVLEPANRRALTQGGTYWPMIVEREYYWVIRHMATGQIIQMAIARDTGWTRATVWEPGQTSGPVWSMRCTRPPRL